LIELLHVWDTQKNESINNFIRGWVPKDTHYVRKDKELGREGDDGRRDRLLGQGGVSPQIEFEVKRGVSQFVVTHSHQTALHHILNSDHT
jgi:hypothetical protein